MDRAWTAIFARMRRPAEAPAPAQPVRPDLPPLEAAQQARQDRAWADAAAFYAVHLADHPRDAAIWVQRGHCEKESGDLDAAAVSYGMALELTPRDADLHLNLGHLRKLMGDAEGSLAAYEAARAADPGLEDAADEAERMKALIAEGRRLPPRRGSEGARLIAAADAARDARRWAEAASFYARYLALVPQDADLWIQRGHAEKEAGDLPAAEAAYREAVALAPRMAEARLQLGHALKRQGRHEEALASYGAALELAPGHGDAVREIRAYAADGQVAALLKARSPAESDLPLRPAQTGALAFCTIASANYMAQVLALRDSLAEHHPEARFILCLAERELPPNLPAGLEVILAGQLGIPDFQGFAFRYSILEFCTALKPYLLRLLLGRCGFASAVYLDPDMLALARMDEVTERLWRDAALVLTPHLRRPAVGHMAPTDLSIMRAGTFNLGFIGASSRPEALALLDWWADHLLLNCLAMPEEGLFVDQKFMDLMPGFTGALHVERHPGLNLAYWNLSEHSLTRHGDFWQVDGQALQLFHFSGYDPQVPDRLSRHTGLFAPIRDEALRALTDRYAALMARHAQEDWRGHGYAFGHFASGARIPAMARRLHLERYTGWREDPFAMFEAVMRKPTEGVPRLLHHIWDTTPMLRSGYDLAKPEDVARFVAWLRGGGAALVGLEDWALEALLTGASPP
ncbi:tetratricopeptide repeat protein [Rhodovarius crocodyli]|uniref:Tetratricopeptide repeat protein n=1 Tax=Rhodovarius crocodyli TaxID=1979269 RepID=A0A437M415_9PROT|nr:tetratricopeptide repeat protein [Rhodovarius crocodyli]RVT92303.1 tetratricopeptide repeat protein [Rhodovarius crocodyli]